jgi:xanthine dehydrogenase accessory factor
MEADIYEEIRRLRREGRKAVLATIVQIRGSVPSFQTAKMLVRDDGSIVGSVGGGCVEADVWAAAQDVIREEKSRVMTFDLTEESMAEGGLICGGKVEIFVEPVLPVPEMIIFGAGHISTQVSKIATVAGFRTTIVDNRPIYANAERFPEAEAIYSESFEQAFEAIVPSENTYLVIVTRGHQEDENVLRWALGTNARYIGMIGSKRKVRTIADHLTEEGIDRDKIEKVHMPIGLEIGAVTPEEIAVAIVAEAIQIRRVGFKHPMSKKLYQNSHS